MQGWVTGRGSGARGAGRRGGTATLRAPGELGVTQPQKPCVCVWSAALLSPACTDATFFLFQIFTADFSLHSCLGPTRSCCFWCSCSFSMEITCCGDRGDSRIALMCVKKRGHTHFTIQILRHVIGLHLNTQIFAG